MSHTLLFLIFIFLITGTSLALMPFLTRRTENFGVSIPESMYKNNALRKMRLSYSTIMFSLLIILISILLFSVNRSLDDKAMIIYISIVVIHLILSFILYLPFHLKMKKLKKELKWTEEYTQTLVLDTSFREENLTVSNWLYLIPFIFVVGTIVYTFSIYHSIPDQVVTHIGVSGTLTYSDKSPGVLLILPLTQLFLIGVFLIINYVIKQSKQEVSVAQPEVSKEQNIKFRQIWARFMFISGTLTVILFSLLQLTFIYEDLIKYIDYVMYPFIGLILLMTLVISIKTGQGGSRLKITDDLDDTVINRDHDQYWKLGQFYFNRNDPSIFIEKRFGIGWSVNFARPLTWVFIIGIFILSLSPLFISIFF